MNKVKNAVLLGTLSLLASMSSFAGNSRILATGGASTVEGAAGGGIVPWAVIAGYGSQGEWGATAFSTQLRVKDYSMNAKGVALSYDNRFEVSYARQTFDLGTLGDALGMSGHQFRQDVVGLKYRVAGDLIYRAWPQLTLGVQHKKHRDFAVPQLVGADRDSDTDFYASAAKVWLSGLFGRNTFLNVTTRYTRANQAGLLGFGGDKEKSRDLVTEMSGGLFFTRKLALGAEYREHPDNLGFSKQHAWRDVFIAYFPNKSLSLVAAYADLGTVATLPGQQGWYVSWEFSY